MGRLSLHRLLEHPISMSSCLAPHHWHCPNGIFYQTELIDATTYVDFFIFFLEFLRQSSLPSILLCYSTPLYVRLFLTFLSSKNFEDFFSYFFRMVPIGGILSNISLPGFYLDDHTLLILSGVFYPLQFQGYSFHVSL